MQLCSFVPRAGSVSSLEPERSSGIIYGACLMTSLCAAANLVGGGVSLPLFRGHMGARTHTQLQCVHRWQLRSNCETDQRVAVMVGPQFRLPATSQSFFSSNFPRLQMQGGGTYSSQVCFSSTWNLGQGSETAAERYSWLQMLLMAIRTGGNRLRRSSGQAWDQNTGDQAERRDRGRQGGTRTNWVRR